MRVTQAISVNGSKPDQCFPDLERDGLEQAAKKLGVRGLLGFRSRL